MIKFIYLQVGSNPKYQMELRYSIATLLAEMPGAAGNIVVYTDAPAAYAADAHILEAVDVSATLAEMTRNNWYFFRAKPSVVAHALRKYNCTCVFLDTDTYFRRGFSRAIEAKLKRGAVMDVFHRRNPYPEAAGLEASLPSGASYRYDPATAVMYNSGVIGVAPAHLAAIEDAVAIIDAVRPVAPGHKDHEQYAINEALAIHGIPIVSIGGTVKHYWSRWQKRYMHWRLGRLPGAAPTPVGPRRPRIYVNKPIGWCFKQAVSLGLLQ
jgi:hypothetical protein